MRCCFYALGGAAEIPEKLFSFLAAFAGIFRANRLSTASAALSYYLTMTVFPLIICLYTMLGNSYESALRIVRLASGILAPDTIRLIEDFLSYISSGNSSSMLVAGLLVLVSYASAALRSFRHTLSAMQGGQKYGGIKHYVFSLAYSLVFLSAIYFAVLVMLTGSSFIAFLNRALPFLDIGGAWTALRFLVLAGIFFAVVWGLYELPKGPGDTYPVHYGALFSSLAMIAVSAAFSYVIGRSSNYPLVYGSLASIILLMLWLYSSCTVIYVGAVINIALRDMRQGIA